MKNSHELILFKDLDTLLSVECPKKQKTSSILMSLAMWRYSFYKMWGTASKIRLLPQMIQKTQPYGVYPGCQVLRLELSWQSSGTHFYTKPPGFSQD